MCVEQLAACFEGGGSPAGCSTSIRRGRPAAGPCGSSPRRCRQDAKGPPAAAPRGAARLLVVAAAAAAISQLRRHGFRPCFSAAGGLAPAPEQRGALEPAAVAGRAARLGGPVLALLGAGAQPANAFFANALPEAENFNNGNKNTGLRPGDIGLDIRKLNRKGATTAVPELKGCRSQENSCFSTLKETMIPGKKITWRLEPWRLPTGVSEEQGIEQLATVISAYPPGQGGIDKGGFRVVEVKPNYIYAQFASIAGLIDDVEFAPLKDGAVLVRSGSRSPSSVLGPSDRFTSPDEGANMKRLNYIAAELRKKGWTAPEITKEEYPFYFEVNGL